MSAVDKARELSLDVQRLTLEYAIDLVGELLGEQPTATAGQARDRLRAALAGLPTSEDLRPDEYECLTCQKAVAQQADGRWAHRVGGKWSNIGCRAASFDRLGTWDDDLDRGAKAKPSRRELTRTP
jgi:hypothetical protein